MDCKNYIWVLGDESLFVPEPECNFDNPRRIENKKFTLLKFQDMNFWVKLLNFGGLVLELLVKYASCLSDKSLILQKPKCNSDNPPRIEGKDIVYQKFVVMEVQVIILVKFF